MPLACARCLDRAGVLTTFPIELEVTLEPGVGGIFEVLLDDASLFSRAERRRFPEPKEPGRRSAIASLLVAPWATVTRRWSSPARAS